jgi:hypothetical protein
MLTGAVGRCDQCFSYQAGVGAKQPLGLTMNAVNVNHLQGVVSVGNTMRALPGVGAPEMAVEG